MFKILAGSYAPADAAGVRGFRFDPELGEFVPDAGRSGVPFPAHLARSAASGCYYAVSETTAHSLPGPGTSAAQTGAFAFDGDTLELITRVPTVRPPGDGVFPADIHSSPDGRRPYVSNRGAVNTIATFDTTRPGRPELIGEASCGGVWPRHFAVMPDGRFLVVANEHSGQLTALAVDSDGRVAAPVASAAMPGASYVEVRTA
jgi:6-phosphogluconolactonase (cycloisomerase 2 family)